MNLIPTDLILRKTNGQEAVWVSQRLLMEVCGVSEEYFRISRIRYKSSVRACDRAKAGSFLPDSGKAWRWGKMGGQYYYCLSNIPDRAPTHYRSLFGDEEALVSDYQNAMKAKETSLLEDQLTRYIKKVSKNYLEFYKQASPTQRVALSKACAVIDFILTEKDDYPGTANQIYKDVGGIIASLGLQYIPKNAIKLKEKITQIEETDSSIIDVIYLPRLGNSNAEVYNDPEVFSWVMQMRVMPQNYSEEHIIRKIQEMCELTSKRVPSRRWFGQTILEQSKTRFLTGEKRYGSSSRKSHIYKGYIPTQNALYAGDCWEMDATRVNFIAHEVDTNGKKIQKNIFVVAVRDVHSGDILGYSFDYAENHVVYLEAMKMAVKNAGYIPYEWITDRFPGHNTPQMKDFFERLESLGTIVQFVHKANNKAGVERFWKTLQSVFLMDSKYFYGEGIQSRANYAHRAPEYLNRIKKEALKEGWNLDRNTEEASLHIEKYRNTILSKYSRIHQKTHQSPYDLHEYSEKPHVHFVTASQISMLFGLRKELTLNHEGQFTTEISGIPFDYMISPAYYEIIANYHNKKVVVTYDMEDLSVVYLWEKNGNLLVSLCDADLFERPQMKGPNKDYGKVAEAKQRAKAIQELKEKDLQSYIEEDAMMGIYTEKALSNAFEDVFYENDVMPLKKASGSDITSESLESIILRNVNDEF